MPLTVADQETVVGSETVAELDLSVTDLLQRPLELLFGEIRVGGHAQDENLG